jgi:hypothetical protein
VRWLLSVAGSEVVNSGSSRVESGNSRDEKNPGSDSRAAQRNLNRHAIVCQAYRAALDSQVGPPLTPHPQHTHTIHHTAQRRSNAQTSAERMQPIRCGPVAKPLARAEADALFGPSGKRRGRRGSFAFGSGRAGRARRREIEGLKAEGTREREWFLLLFNCRTRACLRACVPACVPAACLLCPLHGGPSACPREAVLTLLVDQQRQCSAGLQAQKAPMRMGCVARAILRCHACMSVHINHAPCRGRPRQPHSQ